MFEFVLIFCELKSFESHIKCLAIEVFCICIWTYKWNCWNLYCSWRPHLHFSSDLPLWNGMVFSESWALHLIICVWGYVYYGTKMSTLLTLYGCQKPNIDIPYMTRIQKNELIELRFCRMYRKTKWYITNKKIIGLAFHEDWSD